LISPDPGILTHLLNVLPASNLKPGSHSHMGLPLGAMHTPFPQLNPAHGSGTTRIL